MPETATHGITDAQAHLAACWWANVIRRPKHDALGGQRDWHMEMASVLADLHTGQRSEDQIDRFRGALWGRIMAGEARWGRGAILSCDYHPDPTLADAASDAGITNELSFPWKTTMWLYPDDAHQEEKRGRVFVSYGYRAPIEEVLPAPSDPQRTPT